MKKLGYMFLFLLIFFASFISLAQDKTKEEENPKYYVHSIVKDLAPDYQEVVDFWINFLYEENDDIRRTYWDTSEIKRFKSHYALFYGSLFQFPAKQFLNYFKPYILSVYLDGNTYHIVTTFWNFDFKPSSNPKQNNIPSATIEIGVRKEDNKLYLVNLFDKRIKNWQKFKYGKLNYIISPFLTPKKSEMEEAQLFIDSLSNIFSVDTSISYTYVVCETAQQLSYLLGFNFAYIGVTYGLALPDARFLFSGTQKFNYFHELAHLIINPLLPNTQKFFSEGLATFFGGTRDKNYVEHLKEFKKKYKKVTKLDYNQIIKKPNFNDSYVLGVLVINFIYDSYGVKGILKLKNPPKDINKSLNYVCQLFNLSEKELIKSINDILAKY